MVDTLTFFSQLLQQRLTMYISGVQLFIPHSIEALQKLKISSRILDLVGDPVMPLAFLFFSSQNGGWMQSIVKLT